MMLWDLGVVMKLTISGVGIQIKKSHNKMNLGRIFNIKYFWFLLSDSNRYIHRLWRFDKTRSWYLLLKCSRNVNRYDYCMKP